jgi:hypothetical protein
MQLGYVSESRGATGSCGSDQPPFCVVAMVVEAALVGALDYLACRQSAHMGV